MKKILILLTLILLNISLIYGQESVPEDTNTNDAIVTTDEEHKTVESDNKYFELELIRGIQNPLNGKIPFTLHITPKINSDKTQILWDTPSVFTLETKHAEFVSLSKDITYTYSATVKPNRKGTYDISVNVISWQYDTNRANSVSYTISINNSLTIQPVDSEYTIIILLLVAGVLLVTGIGIYLGVKWVKKLVKKFKIWLTPPY